MFAQKSVHSTPVYNVKTSVGSDGQADESRRTAIIDEKVDCDPRLVWWIYS